MFCPRGWIRPKSWVSEWDAVFVVRNFSVFFAKVTDDRQQTTCGELLGTVGFSISTCEIITQAGECTPEETYIPVSPRPRVTDLTRSNPRLTDDQRPNTRR